jgi:hypothetical protein
VSNDVPQLSSTHVLIAVEYVSSLVSRPQHAGCCFAILMLLHVDKNEPVAGLSITIHMWLEVYLVLVFLVSPKQKSLVASGCWLESNGPEL